MLGYSLRRVAASLLLLWLVVTATFGMIHLAPGDPMVMMGDLTKLTPELRERLERLYGFDRPLPEQYGRWLAGTLRGDWGVSLILRRPVVEVIADRLAPTLLLVLTAVALEHLIGVPLGVAAARRPDSWLDHGSRTLSLLFNAVPSFLLGLVLLTLFAVRWPLFPTGHMASDDAAYLSTGGRILDLLHHLALPALTLALTRCVGVLRHLRNGLLDVLSQDFVLAARARGLSERRVVWGHAVPNVLGPLIQRLGVGLPLLLSGTLVLEVIFSWPGLGSLGYQAILWRDVPLVLGVTAFSAVLVIAGSLAADLTQGWLDPRSRRAV